MTSIDTKPFSCEQCGEPFKPRSGTGGSAQRFCSTAHRLSFHKERLREQRTSRNAGKPVYEQAKRLIPRLTPDERRRLALQAEPPSNDVERAPELRLEPAAPTVAEQVDQGFAEFYRVYPLHVARGAAEQVYRSIVENGEVTPADLLAGAMRYAAAREGKDPSYTKHPATWLKGKCWLDEPAPAAMRPASYFDGIHAGLAVHSDEEGANQIVKVTKKPFKLIDALHCETAKKALTLRNALYPWSASSLETLVEMVAAAEVLVASGQYRTLVGTIETAFAPAAIAEINSELALLYACYPAKDVDVTVLVACSVEELIRERPSVLQLQLACRRIRRTRKFRPTIADMIEALDEAEDESEMASALEIMDLRKRMDDAAVVLSDIVGRAIQSFERPSSDRERERRRRWDRVDEIDEKLNRTRRLLEAVSAHRPKALEAQRLLINQSMSKTDEAAGQSC